MSKIPKVSVIMSVYNGEKFLNESIVSILSQSFKDFEFIIVNDGSTDNSIDIIKDYNDSRIVIVNNYSNIGLTKSLNKALNIAKGKFIARQDADDISLPTRFEKQVKLLDHNPEIALLGTNAYFIDENGVTQDKYNINENPTIDDLLKSNQFIHGSVMFRREIINKIGNYNEKLIYSQDYEFWVRIARKYKVKNLIERLYNRREHQENVRIKNGEYPILFSILSKKLAKGELKNEDIKINKKSDINFLYNELNKKEKIFYHQALAQIFIRGNQFQNARSEYKTIFYLNPLNLKNYINYIISYINYS